LKEKLRKRIGDLETRRQRLPKPFGDPRVYALRLARCKGNPYAFEWEFDDVEYLRRGAMCALIMAKAFGNPEDLAEYDAFHGLFLELGAAKHGSAWVDGQLSEIESYAASIAPIVKAKLKL
jgi:hypothetical protein